MIRLAIFDMDGLIFDTENLFMRALDKAMKRNGYTLTKERYLALLGLNADMCKEKMCSFYGADYPYERISAEARAGIDRLAAKGELPIKKGIVQLVEYLINEDVICAVASSTHTRYVKQYIEGSRLGDSFSLIVGGDRVARSKPNPDIFLAVSRKTRITPGDAVVFEDSDNGIRAGLNGGFNVICIPDMKQPDAELESRLFAKCRDGFEARAFLAEHEFDL